MQLCFQNGYSSRIYVAVNWYSPDTCSGEGGDWETRGWWGIDPGATRHTNVHTSDDWFYWYAEAEDGEHWSGSFTTEVNAQDAFDSCLGIGHSTSDGPQEWEDVGFREHYWPNSWAFSRLTLHLH